MSAETDMKATARQMLGMVAAINSALSARGSAAAVTCYTCHRGEEMPESAPSRPGADRSFLEAIKAERYAKAVLAGEQLCERLNKDYFAAPGASKVTCWTCHRGEMLPRLKLPGSAYADFK